VLEFVQLQEVQVVTDEKDMVLFKVEDVVEGLKKFILQPTFHRLTRNSKTTETEKSTNLATSAKNKEIKTPANKELRPTRQKITPKLGTQRAWYQYRTTEKEKKRNVKKPVKLQECVLLPRGAFPPPPVKTAPTSKKLGALKICKQNFKTEAAPPAPIQQNNYDSLPNSDVITVLKQTLQSLGSLKQEVQMLKEGKENSPALPKGAIPQFPLLEIAQPQSVLRPTSHAGSEDSEMLKTLKVMLAWQQMCYINSFLQPSSFLHHIMIVRFYC